MNRFDEINIGDYAEIIHVITEGDIEKFVDLSGDDNKLHIDKEFAKKTDLKKPVAHGMIGASFISTIIGTKIPGDGALWFSQSLEFLLPVRVGDEITVTAKVINKTKRDNIIELETIIYNQNRQKVTTGFAKVKVIPLVEEKEVEEPIKDKCALVIGATGGIGEKTVLKLAENGFNIVLHYFSNKAKAEQLQALVEEMGQKAFIVQADILNEEDVKEMVFQIHRKFPAITAFVNSSTINISSINFDNLEWNDIQKQLNINIQGNFNLFKYILPNMVENKYGKVVCLTTQYTENVPPENLIHYVTAKSALNGFIKSMVVEYSKKGIRFNLVSPGMTDTELNADIPIKVKLLTETKTPLKRLALPEDVANVINFLCLEDSDYMTGETMRVNGGQVML